MSEQTPHTDIPEQPTIKSLEKELRGIELEIKRLTTWIVVQEELANASIQNICGSKYGVMDMEEMVNLAFKNSISLDKKELNYQEMSSITFEAIKMINNDNFQITENIQQSIEQACANANTSSENGENIQHVLVQEQIYGRHEAFYIVECVLNNLFNHEYLNQKDRLDTLEIKKSQLEDRLNPMKAESSTRLQNIALQNRNKIVLIASLSIVAFLVIRNRDFRDQIYSFIQQHLPTNTNTPQEVHTNPHQ